MGQTLLLYAHLLVFLIGTLLYGFLVRELVRNPSVLPGFPVRILVFCLTVWYGGCLVDELATIFRAPTGAPAPFGAVFDIIRGMAWLASFPLLASTIWGVLAREKPTRNDPLAGTERPLRRPSRLWLVPGYLTLLLFLPAAFRIWQLRSPWLESAARGVFPLVLLHASLSVAVAGWLLVQVIRSTDDGRLKQFLRWLLPALLAMLGLLFLGPVVGIRAGAPKIALGIWRLSSEASGLVLGLTFLYFVQRYNLLRLSLSHRSLRHFVAAMGLVLLVMLYGPAVGIHDTEIFRRLVAFGLVAAVLAAMLYTPLRRAAATRSRKLRRLLGESPTPQELDAFSSRLETLDLPEGEVLDEVAGQIGGWLVTRARFLGPPTDGDRGEALLWRHLQSSAAIAFNRLSPPSNRLAAVLGRTHLHAVFPLRVGGVLENVLGLEVSATGGGYQDGEMESVRLVLRQLGGALQLRRLMETRLAEERTMAEQERLRMLGMVSASLIHEVKNPLSSIKVLAETVGEELSTADPGSEQAEDLGLIVDQIDRLNLVAAEILGFARAPQQPSQDNAVDLSQLTTDTLAVCRYHAKTRGVELDQTGIQPGLRVVGTAAGWQTIALNLVNNAIEHAPGGSSVKVRLLRDGGSVVFETENAGPAMDPEIEERLFEDFVSVGGTGLGLGLVSRRVAEFGGEITVGNIEDRITFTVSCPAVATDQTTEETAVAGEEKP